MTQGPLTSRERAFIRDLEAKAGKLGPLLGPMITLEVIREGATLSRGTAEYAGFVLAKVRDVRQMRAWNRDEAIRSLGSETRLPVDLGEYESERQWTLSAFAWRLAETATSTEAFRSEHLPYGLLDPSEVEKWRDDQGVDAPSLLALRQAARALQRIGGWTRQQAEDYLLTRRTPIIEVLTAEVRTVFGTRLPTSRIVLTIDPVVSPELVMQTYQHLRREMLPGIRQCRVLIRNLRIAAFTAHTPEMTRSKRVAVWNRLNASDPWTGDERSFANVYTQVIEHLTRRRRDVEQMAAAAQSIEHADDRRRALRRRHRPVTS